MSPSQVCIGAAMGSAALIDDRQLSATHDESSSAGRFAMNEATSDGVGRVDDRSSPEGSGDRKPIAVAKTAFDERIGQFSFDGHWVAYQTNESGEFQIDTSCFTAWGQTTNS